MTVMFAFAPYPAARPPVPAVPAVSVLPAVPAVSPAPSAAEASAPAVPAMSPVPAVLAVPVAGPVVVPVVSHTAAAMLKASDSASAWRLSRGRGSWSPSTVLCGRAPACTTARRSSAFSLAKNPLNFTPLSAADSVKDSRSYAFSSSGSGPSESSRSAISFAAVRSSPGDR